MAKNRFKYLTKKITPVVVSPDVAHPEGKKLKVRIHRGRVISPSGLMQIRDFLGDPKATPPIPALLPMSKSAWWAKIKTGEIKPGRKLGPRKTVWPASYIFGLIEGDAAAAGEKQ